VATRNIKVSDISNQEISNGELAEVTIKLASQPTATFRVDALESEVAALLDVARKTGTRGRPRKAKA
jgi:hypothetical protein